MKLLCVFLAILAISFADDTETKDLIDDSEAVASVELLRTAAVSLPGQAGVPPENFAQQNSQQNYWPQPPGSWTPPPPQNWIPPQNTWTTPQNTWTSPQNVWTPAENTWKPPGNGWKPQNQWGQEQNKPGVQHDSLPSTTPVAVIKNEQYYGDNGSYKYEYQIGDGTHVGEEGYLLNPKTEQESLVKKGWYSFVGGDGKTYTVTWWADETGFHATGDHLPKPPPVPPAIQASIEQNAKEEAAKAEAEKNKQQQGQYPQQQYPQQTYPQQPQTYPQQQQTYPQHQQTYPQHQQTYPQHQQTYPQHQHNYPQHQQTYPQYQQTYPQQQQTYPKQQQTYPQQGQEHEGYYIQQHQSHLN